MIRSTSKLNTVLARYRRHLGVEGARRKPSELALMLEQAGPRERADLMAMISRHDAWDEVGAASVTPARELPPLHR